MVEYGPIDAVISNLPLLSLSLALAGAGDQCPDSGLKGSAPIIASGLASAWVQEFVSRNPGNPVSLLTPFGPPVGTLDPALESFLEGNSDFAFLTREIAERDLATFRRMHNGQEPIVIPVAGGAWNRYGYVDAVAIIVNAANPVRRLSFRQLDAIFSVTRRRGGPVAVDWAGLGVKAWRGKSVHLVGGGAWSSVESARALTVRRRVLSLPGRPGVWRTASGTGSEADMVDRVAADPLAIGFTGMGHLKAGVRAVPIAENDRDAAIPATAETIRAATYPLARTVDLLVAPGMRCKATVRRFAQFILSDAGEAMIERDSPFLSLPPHARRQSWRQIGEVTNDRRPRRRR